MRAGRTQAQIVATPPLPHVDGEAAEAVAGRRPSVASEITPAALAVEAGAIGRRALAVGEVAAVAEVGAGAVAASAAVSSAVGGGAVAASAVVSAVVGSVAGGKAGDTLCTRNFC